MSNEKLDKLIKFIGRYDYLYIEVMETGGWVGPYNGQHWHLVRFDQFWHLIRIYQHILDHGDVELLRIVDELFPKFQTWYCEKVNAAKLNYINNRLSEYDMGDFAFFLSDEAFEYGDDFEFGSRKKHLPLERCIVNGATDCVDYFMKEHKTVFFPDREGIQFSYPLCTAYQYGQESMIDYLINNHIEKLTEKDINETFIAALKDSNDWVCARLLPYATTPEINA